MATLVTWQILHTNHHNKAQLGSHAMSTVTKCVISLPKTTKDV